MQLSKCYISAMNELRKNDIYDTVSDGYTSEALGVCRINGRPVFVAGAVKGESLSVRITKAGQSASYGRIECIHAPSVYRIDPDCPHYKSCGGCSTLHMSYDEELRFKLDKVNNALSRIGRQTVNADEIVPGNSRSGYRNKVTFQVSQNGGKAYFGYYSQRTHNVVPVSECAIADKRAVKTAAAVVGFMNENGITAYDEITQKGAVRHIFIRNAVKTDDICVCISSAEGFGNKTSAFVTYLISECPYLTGIVLNINKQPGNKLLKGDFYTLFGNADITDSLSGFRFRISPKSFYQINPLQAEKLYSIAVDFAGKDSGTCLDLYCGIGTISLCLSKVFDKVIGVEIVPEAIENAVFNANRNGISNVDFICADTGGALRKFESEGIRIDTAVVDPPRKGMDPEAIETVCKMKPGRIVYVSCNPATLARDLLLFNELGYQLIKAKAVDMFPGTSHVETVCLLSRNK